MRFPSALVLYILQLIIHEQGQLPTQSIDRSTSTKAPKSVIITHEATRACLVGSDWSKSRCYFQRDVLSFQCDAQIELDSIWMRRVACVASPSRRVIHNLNLVRHDAHDATLRRLHIVNPALASTWACDKFSDYVLGRNFHIEPHHKPMVPLLTTKHLDSLPPRIVRFRLRLARYDYTISHVPEKLLHTADTLSRAPLPTTIYPDSLQQEVEVFIES